jgi:hypothetical protein
MDYEEDMKSLPILRYLSSFFYHRPLTPFVFAVKCFERKAEDGAVSAENVPGLFVLW